MSPTPFLHLSLTALAATLVPGAGARAQGSEIDPRRYGTGGDTFLTLDGPKVPRHLDLAAGVSFDYTADLAPPLRVPIYEGGVSYGQSVTERFTLAVAGAIGLFDRAAVMVTVPFVLEQSSEAFDEPYSMQALPSLGGASAADLAAGVKALLYERGIFAGGAALEVSLPTGDPFRLHGERGPSIRPSVSASLRDEHWVGAAQLGFVIRTDAASVSAERPVDDQLSYGLAGRFRFVPEVAALAEVSGLVALDGAQLDYASPFEPRLGAEWTRSGLAASAGVGVGLGPSDGAPVFRAFVSIRYETNFGMSDRDGDGVRDAHDRCADERELDNGVADDDGCPEPDRDRDTVPDDADSCPDHAGGATARGCPPERVDSDADGIPDVRDGCRDAAEDTDGDADEDGCPDVDADERDGDVDGVPDVRDACPDAAEETDGYEDEDGCPETRDATDADGDGVMDAFDACPEVHGSGDDGCAT